MVKLFLFFSLKKTNHSILKSVLIRKWIIQLDEPKYLFVPIIKTILQIIKIFIFIPFGLTKKNSKKIILNGGTDDLTKKSRHYFVNKFTPTDSILFFDLGVKTNYYYKSLSLTKIWKIFKLTLFIVVALITQFFQKSSISLYWASKIYQFLIQLILIEKEGKSSYIFILYGLDVYMAALIAGEWLQVELNVITSNSLLYSNNRYTYLPKTNLVYCSVLQADEIKMYQQNNWVNVKSTEFWGLEESIEYDKVDKKIPSYDIGLFSTGGWARKKNFMRNSLESIQKNGVEENLLSDIFDNIILEAITALKSEYPQLKIKIYPHPHERFLMEKGLKPSYLATTKALDIDIDMSPGNSIHKIYESKIGISSLSTIIFDRMNYGLKGFIFSGKDIKDFNLNPKYMGEYSEMCFDDKYDLKQKIIKELKLVQA